MPSRHSVTRSHDKNNPQISSELCISVKGTIREVFYDGQKRRKLDYILTPYYTSYVTKRLNSIEDGEHHVILAGGADVFFSIKDGAITDFELRETLPGVSMDRGEVLIHKRPLTPEAEVWSQIPRPRPCHNVAEMNRPSVRLAIAHDLEEHPEIENLPAILHVREFNGREYELHSEHYPTLRAAMERAYELPWDENTFVSGVVVESGKYRYPLGPPWQVPPKNDFEWYWKHRLGKK